jgi:hypothetical protein
LRLLGRGCVVKIDQRLAVDLHGGRRKVGPNPVDVVRSVCDRRMHDVSPATPKSSTASGARTPDFRRSTMLEIPETMLVRIKSAGHIPMENDPKAVAGALAEFFAAER